MATHVLDPAWIGVEGIFGGYVLAVAVAAVDTRAFPGYRPQSVTLAFVSTLQPGDVEIVAEPLHAGRSTGSVRIALVQDGRLRAHGIGSLVRQDHAPVWETPCAPLATRPEHTDPYVASYGKLPYLDQLDLHGVGRDSMSGGATAWVRTRGEAGDGLSSHARLALYLDVMPPGMFAAEPRPRFVPSLELTAHFSPRAAFAGREDEWFSVCNRTVWASEAFCVDECELRDHEGHLVAQLRQGRQVRG